MEIFPTQYSTLSAKALNDVLQAAYGFEDTTCRLLIRNVSDTYIVENATLKYIFKIYRDAHRSLEEIQGELALLNELKDKDAKVSYPISDLNGSQIQSFNAAEGTRYGVLFSFAMGDVAYELTDEQLALIAKEMARIHNLTSVIDIPFYRKEYSIHTTLLDPIRVIEPSFSKLSEEYGYLRTTTQAVVAAIEKFNLSEFSYGYCQYDFLPKNFHFQGATDITFFDFDFAGKGYLINDITSFLVHYFLESVTGKISAEEAKRCFSVFVNQYRKIRPLSVDELKSIKYFGFSWWMFYFQFHFENFDDWSSIFYNDKFIKGRVGLIKQWMDWELFK